MFNPEQKEQFIQFTLEKSNVANKEKYEIQLTNFFKRITEIEQEIGKDFAMFNFDEIKLALSIICRRSVKYQKSILSQLRQYMEWAIDSGKSLDKENRLIGISPKDIDFSISYKMSMVKDEDQLIDYLELVLRPLEDDTIDNMYKTLFQLVFNGLTFEEAIDLKRSDVDLKTSTIKLKNRNIKISSDCRNMIQYLCSMTSYTSSTSKNKNTEIVRDIADTGHVLERTVDSRENMDLSITPPISNIFSKLKEKLGFKISITLNDIHTSGIFYRMYLKELETGELDFSEYMHRSELQSSTIYNPDYTIEEGMEEYKSWKKAFDLN